MGEVPLAISCLERWPLLTLADGSIAIYSFALKLPISRETWLVGKLSSIKACLGKRKGRTQNSTNNRGRRLSRRSIYIWANNQYNRHYSIYTRLGQLCGHCRRHCRRWNLTGGRHRHRRRCRVGRWARWGQWARGGRWARGERQARGGGREAGEEKRGRAGEGGTGKEED